MTKAIRTITFWIYVLASLPALGPGIAESRSLFQGNPGPQPAPAMPGVLDRGGAALVTIEGMIVVQTGRHPDDPMEIRLEGPAGERIGLAYTDDAGRFAFRDLTIRSDSTYFVVAEIEGYRPYRERLDRQYDMRFGGRLTVVLEPPAVTTIDRGDSRPVVDVRDLLSEIPPAAAAAFDKATEASEQGNIDESIAHLERALALAPDYAEAHNTLGRQYLLLDRVEDARSEFKRARSLRPAWVIPLINLGTVEYQQGEAREADGYLDEAQESYRQAVELLEEAILVDPLSPLANSLLGTSLYKVGDYTNAEERLRRALDLSVDMDEARLSLINVYNRQGRFPEALGVVDEYLDHHPDSPVAPSLEKVRRQLEEILERQ